MASRGGMKPLRREEIEELVAKGSSGRMLLAVHFALAVEDAEEGDVTTGMGYMVYSRSGGFMMVVPLKHASVRSTLDSWSEHGSPLAPGFLETKVTLETSRGRAIGDATVELVDFPWGAASYLWHPSGTRKEIKVLGFEHLGQIGRPNKASAYVAADAWISAGDMDEDTAADYATGEELGPDEPEEPSMVNGSFSGGSSATTDLGTRAAGSPASAFQSSTCSPSLAGGAYYGGDTYFQSPAFVWNTWPWSKLQKLAGPPPPRIGRAETRRGDVGPSTTAMDNAFLLEEREVEEPTPLEPLGGGMDLALGSLSTGGALEKLLAVQLQQNHLLLQKLVGQRSTDPVLGALSGSDNAGGSSSGVKGCVAREAFVKAMQDLPKVGRLARQQAMEELGIPFSQEDGSLMRVYMERRMCLAEHRLLSYVTMMLVESWTVAFDAKDELMMGALARMLFFVEQASIDNGKLQLAWLLTGIQDPPFHLLTSRKKQPGLQPFARLCPPSWVSGNLAYLRDLDYTCKLWANLSSSPPRALSKRIQSRVQRSSRNHQRGAEKGRSQQRRRASLDLSSWEPHSFSYGARRCLAAAEHNTHIQFRFL